MDFYRELGYSVINKGGIIMKKTYLRTIMILASAIAVSVTAYGAQWYDTAVEYCRSAGYISEDYDINGSLTRGGMAEMLSKAAGLSSDGTDNPFADVSSEDSFADDITALYKAGIFAGVEQNDGTLLADPNGVLTREQAASFLIRAYGFKNSGGGIDFADSEEVSDYAVDDVKALVGSGVISGYEDNTFRPKGTLSKTEFIMMLYKSDEAAGKDVTVPERSEFTDDEMSDNLALEVINEETPYDALELRFTRHSEDPGALYVYNPQKFTLEKSENGQWTVMERNGNEVKEIEYQLKADSSGVRKITLSDFYDSLEPGRYRIIYEFSVNGVGIEKRSDYVSAEFDLTEAPVDTELYEKIEEYLKAETEKTFSKYYEILGSEISNYEENDDGTEAIFFYKIIHKNFDKDPDTVEYIREAKENNSPYYETYYKEYLEPKEMNFYFKAVDGDDGLKLYSDDDPTGNTDWQETKLSDYIL